MTNKIISVNSLLLVVALFGCQSIVDNVDLPEIDVEPVVHFRYDGAVNTYDCSLTQSNPIFGEKRSDFAVIEHALVTITGTDKTDTLLYDAVSEAYRKDATIQFEVGKRYDLNITLPDGGTMYAQSEYPHKPQNVVVDIDSTTKDFETIYRIKTSWDDIPGVHEYYMLETYQVFSFDGDKDTVGSYVADVVSADDIKSRLTAEREAYTYSEPGSSFSVKLFVVISGITQEEYKYLQFLQRYEPENPFTEPTTIPSNVQGGLGMFTLKNSEIFKF